MSEESKSRRGYRVRGRVQGVGFRWATLREAERLGLCGWVRNQPDGSVEITAEGTAGGLARLERWLREGPRGARVEGVEVVSPGPVAPDGGFHIR